MQKKSLDNTRLIMIYNKNKKVLGDFDTKIHATKSHMASLYSVKITMKTTAQFSTMNNYAVYMAAWVVEFRTYLLKRSYGILEIVPSYQFRK